MHISFTKRAMAMSSLMRSRSLHIRFRALFSTKQTPSVFAWGAGNFGQLGNGHTTDPNQTESLGEAVRKNTTGIVYSERFPIEVSYVGGKTEDGSTI